MRLRLRNIFLSIALISLIFILSFKLFETKDVNDSLNALRNEGLYGFVINHNTSIQTLTKTGLEEKLKSPLWTFYAGLPREKEYYEVLSLDENYDGYLIFIDVESDTVVKKLQVHNFRIQ